MRCAIIDKGKVANVAVADDPEFVTEMGWIVVPDDHPVSPGWAYDGITWTPPGPVAPAPNPAMVAAVASLALVTDPTKTDPAQATINEALAVIALIVAPLLA